MSIALRISGTPRITGLDGLFFLDNPDATGFDRVWRSKGTGRVYYDEGWKIGDIMTSMIYFAEDPEPVSAGESVWCDNPWEVMIDNWRPAKEEYADFRPVIVTTSDSGKTETNTEISEPYYVATNEYYSNTGANDITKFDTVTVYYYRDTRVLGSSILERFIHVPVLIPGNKIDTAVYYNYDSVTDTYSYTTDQYFLSEHEYYIKDDGATPVPQTQMMLFLSELDSQIANATSTDARTQLELTKSSFETAVSKKDWRTVANLMGYSNDKLYYRAPFANDSIPSNTYFVEAGTKLVTIHTVVDNRTGESVSNTSVLISRSKVDIDLRTRYFVPDLEIGHIYRFAFVKDFKYLGYLDPSSEDYDDGSGENDSDITRGVFKVTNQMSYYNLLLSGVDVYQNLYLPLKIPRTVYETDRKSWMNDDIWYELTDPSVAARVFYVPLGIISGTPDANVHEYNRHQLIIDIGIFKDPEFLAELITSLNLLMRAKFGMPTTAKLASYDKVYIPDEYYDWLERERKENIENFMTENSDQFYKTLFYDKFNKLYKENLELKQKNQSYEKTIAQLAAGGNS